MLFIHDAAAIVVQMPGAWENQGQLSKLNRPHFWGVKGIQELDTVKLPGCLGLQKASISGFDLTVCWRVSVHLRVWKRPMRDERMGARLVRCRILPPRLTRAIIKPGGCHLCGARTLVFIYADYCALWECHTLLLSLCGKKANSF